MSPETDSPSTAATVAKGCAANSEEASPGGCCGPVAGHEMWTGRGLPVPRFVHALLLLNRPTTQQLQNFPSASCLQLSQPVGHRHSLSYVALQVACLASWIRISNRSCGLIAKSVQRHERPRGLLADLTGMRNRP